MKIKIHRRSLMPLYTASAQAVGHFVARTETQRLLLLHIMELRDRLATMLNAGRDSDILQLSSAQAAAIPMFFERYPPQGHDSAQAVRGLLSAIEEGRREPGRAKLEII